MEKLTMTINEVSEQLGVSLPTARKVINSEGFPVLLLGKRKIIPVAEFLTWMKKNSYHPLAEVNFK